MKAPPAAIKVGPHEYRVVTIPDGILSDSGCVGMTAASKLVISLCSNQAPSQVADTLLHEIIHALLRTVTLDRETEESVCLALGPGLLGVVQDNPELVRWLAKR